MDVTVDVTMDVRMDARDPKGPEGPLGPRGPLGPPKNPLWHLVRPKGYPEKKSSRGLAARTSPWTRAFVTLVLAPGRARL